MATPKHTLIVPGNKYGKLTVLATGRSIGKRHYFLCLCDCGTEKEVRSDGLTSGRSSSCGCVCVEAMRLLGQTRQIPHQRPGYKDHPLYQTWSDMRQRCYNPKNKHYHDYGGRGIAVCERWDEFKNFLADMDMPPPKHSIDRIDNNGDYEPDNCRWATAEQQANNTRVNSLVTYEGMTKTLSEWSRHVGLSHSALYYRIKKSQWSVERAFTTPPL